MQLVNKLQAKHFSRITTGQNKTMTVQQDKNAPKNIAIIDDFTNKTEFIDNDDWGDVAHGQLIKKIIKEGLPDAKIRPFEIRTNINGTTSGKEINKVLDEVIMAIDSGEKFDAINISLESTLPLKEVSKQLGKQITPENLKENRELVKNLILKINNINGDSQIKRQFEKLEKITAKGVPVYIAASNGGKSNFNPYSLAKGVKTVGSLDKKGAKANFSADNSLITNWEPGVFGLTTLKDKNNKIGYDITDDGTIDVYPEQLTSPKEIYQDSGIEGTSYSTPKAIVRDLKHK